MAAKAPCGGSKELGKDDSYGVINGAELTDGWICEV